MTREGDAGRSGVGERGVIPYVTGVNPHHRMVEFVRSMCKLQEVTLPATYAFSEARVAVGIGSVVVEGLGRRVVLLGARPWERNSGLVMECGRLAL